MSEADDADEAAEVHHVGQATADLPRAITFYTELLGFVVEHRMKVPDRMAGPLLDIAPPVELEAAYLRRGAFVLELMQFHRPGNPAWRRRVFNEPGLTHLSMSVRDLDATVDRVTALGGEILHRLPAAAMVRDPDGQLLELVSSAFWRNYGASATH